MRSSSDLPMLSLVNEAGDELVFSARVPRTRAGGLLAAAAAPLAAAALSAQHPSAGLRVAAVIAALVGITLAILGIIGLRVHRTLSVRSDGSATVTEALGLDKETRWEGSLADFSHADFSSGFLALEWAEPGIPPVVCQATPSAARLLASWGLAVREQEAPPS